MKGWRKSAGRMLRRAVPAWGKPPCQAGCRYASSRLRLTAVCPFNQEFFCKQACDRNSSPRLEETAMPSGILLRCIPLAADRRMFCQTEHSLQASLRRMLCLTERMAVFETKFDKGLCRLAWKRYNCLERHVFFADMPEQSWRRYVKRYFN